MANCRYCGSQVTWVKEGRKNVPVEGDGGVHECDAYRDSKNSYRELKPTEIDPDLLKQYQENMNNALKKKPKK